MIEGRELVALLRSAAMLTPGQPMPVPRELLVELCEELLAARQLLERLGTDLRAVAARAKRPDGRPNDRH